jgi:hypothetical protein
MNPMNNTSVTRALPRLLLAITILCMACSGGVDDHSGGPASLAPEPVQRTQAALASSADGGGAAASTDSTWAAAVSMAPWTQCTVSPDGASSGESPTAMIQAGADGEARFFPPPSSSWGTQLILKCSLNGSPSQYVVDLNDSSTFKRESGSDLDARPNGMRPALTGDLSAISQDALLRQGYSQRPDPIGSPRQYANWVKSVTSPASKFMPVSVTSLTVQGDGDIYYEGNLGNDCTPWTGFIQSAAGFVFDSCETNNTQSSSQLYESYFTIMLQPVYYGCSFGNCDTLLWAGIGGLSVYGVSTQPSLLQSGFQVTSFGNLGRVNLYWEYLNAGWQSNHNNGGGAHLASMPSGFNSGDEIWVWGWAAPSSSCGLDATAAPWACFEWEDRNTYTVAGPYPVQIPTGTSKWLPTTFQFIAEVEINGYNNAGYGQTVMEYSWAYDWNGTGHPDPGQSSSTDAWVYAQATAVPSGDDYNNGYWYNGNVTWAETPYTIAYDNAN